MSGVYYNTFGSNVSIKLQQSTSMNAFVYSIASSDQEVLMAPAGDRQGLMVYNDSIYNLYIKFGEGVSADSFTVKLAPEGTYEMSQNITYNGSIYAIWDQIDGSAQVTQLL